MNYPVSSTSSRSIFHFIFRLGVFLLLAFFVAFFVLEFISFLRLFEVKTVTNPPIR